MEQLKLPFVRRRLWLILLLLVLLAASTYLVIERQPQIYVAWIRLKVEAVIDPRSPRLHPPLTGSQLTRIVAEMARKRKVLAEVIERVGVPITPTTLRSNLRIVVDEEAQILTLWVKDGDPVLATRIANALAEMLVSLSPSGGESLSALIYEQMLNQTTEIEEVILGIESRIELQELDLDSAKSSEEQVALLEQIAQERARLTDAQNTLAILYDSLGDNDSLGDSVSSPVSIIDSGLQTSRFDLLSLVGVGFGTGAQSPDGSIRGSVFEDLNSDGVCVGTGEPGLPDIPIEFAYGSNVRIWLQTVQDGIYSLDGVGFGTWQVTVQPGTGFSVTSQQSFSVTLTIEEPEVTGIDFCVAREGVMTYLSPIYLPYP